MGGFSQTTFGFFNTGVGSTPPPTDPAIVVVGAGANSTVRCGLSNTASGGRSTVFGYNNTASGVDSAVYGGTCHTAAGNFSFIGGGNINIAANVFATVVGGQLNTACQRGSFIGGGINNIVNTAANAIYGGSVIAGGVGNNTTGGTYDESLGCFTVAPTACLSGQYSFIGGGFQNISGGCYSAVGGGRLNTASGRSGTISGGDENIASGQWAAVGGGRLNHACASSSFIGGGFNNRVCASGLCGGIIGASNILNHACSYVMGVSLSSDEANTSFFNNIKTGGARFAYSAKTADYTIVQTDYTINVTANSPTITLPTAVGISGKVYVVKNTGAGTVTLATTSAQTIDGAATQSIAANTSLMVQSTNANWIII